MYLVEQGDGIAGNGLFGRRAGTPAITPVMQQIQGVVRERLGEPGQVARDVFGIAAKINQRVGTLVRSDGHQHLCVGSRQGEQRRVCTDGARLRVVNQRSLENEQRHAQRQVQRSDDDDE
ncbi:hypothetical protein D3C76_1178970 [compost metagenome]